MCCRSDDLRDDGVCELLLRSAAPQEGCILGDSSSLPPGVILHDNALFEMPPAPEQIKREIETKESVPAADSITLLCEEVSRLFTQYNNAFKRSGGSQDALEGDQMGGALSSSSSKSCKNMLRCVVKNKSSGDRKTLLLEGDVPALG